MSSYVSATFEKDHLATSDQVRVITRNRDDGDVPPDPSATYYPTDPDNLQSFIVGEFIGSTVGERFNRVATTTDLATITPRTLNSLRDTTGDFIVNGVQAGDIVEVTLADTELWTSTEYPSSNPFTFQVQTVESANVLTVSPSFPSYLNDFNWEIPNRGIQGITGSTRRDGNPSGGTEFIDTRFASFFTNAASAEEFVAATKADLDTLATDTTGASLVDEHYTGTSSI